MGTLYKAKPEAWPFDAGWLSSDDKDPEKNCSKIGHLIVLRALRDNGIVEVPNGSNRGSRIDRYVMRPGSPLGSWWCALWVGAVWADCGATVPRNYGSTDEWIEHLLPGGAKATPQPGDVILYGLHKAGPRHPKMNAHHIGIVARVPEPAKGQHITLSIEGNRGYAGTTNNGVAVDLNAVTRTDILGYVRPSPP